MTAKPYDQIVYVLQGGGALGSYQVGVCSALLKHDYTPNWIIGTSIGAVNAAIIVGNKPEDRIPKLFQFWNSITYPTPLLSNIDDDQYIEFTNWMNAQWVTLFGQPGFFRPRLFNPWFFTKATPDNLSFYDTAELKHTLQQVINFDLINDRHIRLTLAALHVKSGKLARFDNTKQIITADHIMASCALPPGFPAVKIDDEYFWDGGLSSNTPFTTILEEKIPQKLLCFIVDLFAFPDKLPKSMVDVLKIKKELTYVSRHQEVLHYFCELHYQQHLIDELAKKCDLVEDSSILKDEIKRIADIGHPTSLDLVHLVYDNPATDLWSSDYNFARTSFNSHLKNGYRDAYNALKDKSWLSAVTDETGISMHEY